MKKAVIFDMDGLMIDSERVTYEGYLAECSERGYEMTYALYQTLLGSPMTAIRATLREYFGEFFPLEEVITAVHRYVENIFSTQGVPMKPGLMEILEYTREHNYKTMVATSSDRDRVDRILTSANIEGYFTDVICGNEVEKGKPHPDIFLKSCEKLKIQPEEAIVIEDSEQGVQAADKAGIDVICIPDMKEPRKEFKDMSLCVVDSLFDAINILETTK